MIKQFDARYRVKIYSVENSEFTVIEYPITCKFTVSRGVFAQSNNATIQLYNLAPSTRNKIFQDQLNINPKKFKYVHLEAGWNGAMSEIFFGRIMQAYSAKAGGQTDIITTIQAVAQDIFDFQTSHTFQAGTTFKDALKTIAADMPNITVGNIGNLEGTFKTPTTFDGNAMQQINKLTGGNSFVDNGILNTIMSNEVIDVPVPVISDSTTLLETPVRKDANIEVRTLFLPDLISGQLVEINSSSQPIFNGQFKLVDFTHDCLISPTQAGTRTTRLVLWIGPMLPNSDIALTGYKPGEEPVRFNKVKGENISSVNPTTIQPKWIRPCPGRITSGYGSRIDPIEKTRKDHKGIDIGAPTGTPVKAIADGTVEFSAYEGANGNKIKINHGIVNGKNVASTCIHLNSRSVQQGQKVKQGAKIGTVGSTGRYPNGKPSSTGPHLHISIYETGTPVNPRKYIEF